MDDIMKIYETFIRSSKSRAFKFLILEPEAS